MITKIFVTKNFVVKITVFFVKNTNSPFSHLYIIFLTEVTDDLRGKDFGFGTHALRTKVFRIRPQPTAEGVTLDTRRSG